MVQKNSVKPKIIAIIGPTASGKTSLAVHLAKTFNAEIVSADSMQIYKGLDIGTAKVTTEEMDGVPHYMLDVAEINSRFTASDWVSGAKNAIEEILKKSKLPIIAGGTGLYISSLIYGYNFYNAKEDFKLREKYTKLLEEKGSDYLYNILIEKDPSLKSIVDKSKPRQIIRYLEIALGSSEDKRNISGKNEEEYNYLLLGLDVDRELLYSRINQRVAEMVKNGLVDEVKSLVSGGMKEDFQGALAIGYKEIISYLNGEITLESAIELIKKNSRNYAKRQLTWMRKMKNLVWVSPTETDKIIRIVQEFLN